MTKMCRCKIDGEEEAKPALKKKAEKKSDRSLLCSLRSPESGRTDQTVLIKSTRKEDLARLLSRGRRKCLLQVQWADNPY